MDRYLQPGTQVNNPEHSVEYKIKHFVGSGASCAVYYAETTDKYHITTDHLLKEYNPRGIQLERAEGLSIRVCSERDQAAFATGLKRFEHGFQMQANVRRSSETMNSTSNIQCVFSANGTCYIDMTVMSGETYEKVEEKSLYDLLRRIEAIAKVVGSYHEQGLLHLDIKPDNILTLPETVELVQMFDFDSVIRKTDVSNSICLSYTQSWAAQEQILPNRRNCICEATDIFAIGEMLFYKLMGRHSEIHERRSFANFSFDHGSSMFKGVNPRVFPLLTEILKHTICNVIENRYQNTAVLLEKLEHAIHLSNPHEYFLQHQLPSKSAFFVGREPELQLIDERLQQNSKLFISGMGGIGKSELVRQYAHKCKDAYDAVIFSMCNTDLEAMLLDDSALPICNMHQWPDEKAKEYRQRKQKTLMRLCNEQRVLIIVDNFNNLQDNYLEKLMQLNCKMLFTTRCDVTEYNYEQVALGAMAKEYVREIFLKWYKRPLSDHDSVAVEKIIAMYQGHTMAVELIAKQMQASCMSPEEMLDKLGAGGFGDSAQERVIHAKDGTSKKLNIYDHIRRLFDIAELSEAQIYILANLSLLPPSGIPKHLFHDWCKLDTYEDINDLTESGWVRQDIEKEYISTHPVIADIMFECLKTNISLCNRMLTSIFLFVEDNDFAFTIFDFRSLLYGIIQYIIEKISVLNYSTAILAEFVNTVALHFYQYGMIETFILALNNTITFYESNFNDIAETLAEIHNTLGIIYQASKQFDKAMVSYSKSLDIKLTIYGGQHEKIATAYNNLGFLSSELCQYAEAEDYYAKALDIWNVESGRVSTDTATAYNNLGNLYSATGRLDEAEACLLKSLKIMYELNGEKHGLIATIYLNLGYLYQKKRVFEKAHDYLFKSLNLSIYLYGEKYDLTSKVCNAIGMLYNSQQQHGKAEKYLKKALTIKLDLYGECYNGVASIYINLGLVYYSLKQYGKAEEIYMKAKDILLKIYGEKHRHVAILYFNFGSLYEAWENLEKAKEYYLLALLVRVEILGKQNPDTITSLVSLGAICKKMRHFEEAEQYYTDALETRKVKYGENHYYTGVSYFNLGVLYGQMGNFEQAIASHQKALAVRLKTCGATHKETASSHYHLGLLYYAMGCFEKAHFHYSAVLRAYGVIYGPLDIHNAKLYRCMGVLYREQKMYNEALNHLENALQVTQRVYGDVHVDTASIYSALGKTYAELSNYDTAEECYIKALKIRTQLLGETHESVAFVRKRLQELYDLRNNSGD